jgi:hypothetical protein
LIFVNKKRRRGRRRKKMLGVIGTSVTEKINYFLLWNRVTLTMRS